MPQPHDTDATAQLARAREAFDAKQARFSQEVAAYPRWQFDDDGSVLRFFGDDGASRAYRAIPIGTWLPDAQDWAWAWANDAFPEASRLSAEAFKSFEDLTGQDRFTRPHFHAHAQDVGELCLLAILHLDAHAQFRTMGELRAYWALQPA